MAPEIVGVGAVVARPTTIAGVCLEDDAYDIGRVQDEVIYRDNGVNLEVSTLPVTEPSLPFGGG